ncbi:MAG: YaeQ family protein, partial [Nitrospira sp.]
VYVYAYGGRAADQWWKENVATLERLKNLSVMNLSPEGSRALAGLAQRNLEVHCTSPVGQVLIGDGTTAVQVEVTTLKMPQSP